MTEVACTIDGKATGELPAEAICALFQPALEARPGARVHITMPSDHQAQVQLFDADGSVLAEGGGIVSDRQYHRGAWERLVVAIIQQLG